MKNQKGGYYHERYYKIVEYSRSITTLNDISKWYDIDEDNGEENYDTWFDLNKLKIIHSFGEIDRIYRSFGYIQLRPYNKERVLIIGCGNGRLDDRNIGNCSEYHCKQNEEYKFHSHENAYTIDLTLVANSSIVGDFNEDIKLRTIPDNSFEIIRFEGGGDPFSNDAEIKRLLDSNTLSYCISDHGTVGTYLYSSYREGVYSISSMGSDIIEREREREREREEAAEALAEAPAPPLKGGYKALKKRYIMIKKLKQILY
jgi:hypothetical protein